MAGRQAVDGWAVTSRTIETAYMAEYLTYPRYITRKPSLEVAPTTLTTLFGRLHVFHR